MSETLRSRPVPPPAEVVTTAGVRVPRSLATSAAYGWRFLVLVAAAYVVLRGLVALRIVVLPVIVGLLFASFLVHPLRALRRRGMGRGLAGGLVVLLALLIMVAIVTVVSRSVASEFGNLTENVDQGIAEVQDWFVNGPLGLSRTQVEGFADQVREGANTNRSAILSGVATGVHVAAEVGADSFSRCSCCSSSSRTATASGPEWSACSRRTGRRRCTLRVSDPSSPSAPTCAECR
jgi:hypothetical protein